MIIKLIIATCTVMVIFAQLASSAPVLDENPPDVIASAPTEAPISKYANRALENATNFLETLGSRFDSHRNFTIPSPSELMARIRDHANVRIGYWIDRWNDMKYRAADRTAKLLDRVIEKIDMNREKAPENGEADDKIARGKEDGDNEDGTKKHQRITMKAFRAFLDALRNTIRNMMQNLRNPQTYASENLDAVRRRIADGLEREIGGENFPALNAIDDELRATLKKLDKETREKYANL